MNARQQVIEVINIIFKTVVIAIAFAIPLFFWNITSEFYETPKFLIVAGATALLLLLWGIRSIVYGRVLITKTPIDIPLLLILVSFIVSTFFAVSKSVAIIGNLPRIHGGLATYVVYILFYFALVLNLRQSTLGSNNQQGSSNTANRVILYLMISGILLSFLSLASYFGLDILGFAWTKGLNFTPTGSSFSTAALLVLLSPFLLMTILSDGHSQTLNVFDEKMFADAAKGVNLPIRFLIKIIAAVILGLFGVVIVLTGYTAVFIAAIVSLMLVLFAVPTGTINKSLPLLIAPLLITAAVAVASFVPIGGSVNIFHKTAQSFPRELQLPFATSWKISVSAFRDSPFWGTGPASYLFNFTTYKPIEFNATKIWNIRFDQAYSEYLQILGTNGALGLVALLLLTVVFLSVALKVLTSNHDVTAKSLAIAGILFFVLLATHPSTLVLWVLGILILALFMVVQSSTTEDLQVGIAAAKNVDNQLRLSFDALPEIILIIIALLTIGSGYYIGKSVKADIHHRNALNAVAANRGIDAYNELIAAENLNPNVDLYRTDLAQTNFALANAIAIAKGPTQASPAGSLTDQDRQNIQTLLSQAINEARMGVTLSPNNAGNWEILASIYRQISGVAQNALAFSLDSYGRAIQQDPLNPNLRLNVGGIYYSIKSYDLAVRFFTDSANLKPDFANAYYNLAIALKDKGDLAGATQIAEKTVSLLDPNSSDYKTASELLAQIKQQSGEVSNITPPASEPTSALQNQNLPKVLDDELDASKREKVATPAAVKKPEEQKE